MSTIIPSYVVGAGLGIMLIVFAVREHRWWNWLQMAGLVVMTAVIVGHGTLPVWLETFGAYLGAPLLVAGVVAWRLYHDAGWFRVGGRFGPKENGAS